MRILHLLPNLSGGGAERQFGYLAMEQSRTGHEVHAAYALEGPAKPQLTGVILHELRSRSNYDIYILWQLVRLIKKTKPDVIQTWILQMNVLGGIAAIINKVPWIIRESSSKRAYMSRTWKHRLRDLVAGFAMAIVSNSRGGNSYWLRRYPKKRLYVIPNGFPFHIMNKISAQAPDHVEAIKGEKVLLYAGRLEAVKNINKLIDAFSCICRSLSVKLVICGEGPMRSELERKVKSLGLGASVSFAGFVEDQKLWAWMKYADLFCSLSYYEGSPNTATEAIACDCPLLLSDIPAHREFMDQESAVFADPVNSDVIGKKMKRLLLDRKTAKVRASNAKVRVMERSISAMALQYNRVYEDALKAKNQRSKSRE